MGVVSMKNAAASTAIMIESQRQGCNLVWNKVMSFAFSALGTLMEDVIASQQVHAGQSHKNRQKYDNFTETIVNITAVI